MNTLNQLKFLGLLLVLFGGLFGYYTWRVHSLEVQLADTRIERDSTAAEHDQLKKWNDSTWLRMAIIQHRVKDLEGKLDKATKVVGHVTVVTKPVESHSQGIVATNPDRSLTLTGTMDTTPIHVVASVTLRDNLTPPAWSWKARVDPLTISLDVKCMPTPHTHVQVPTWAEVQKLETRLDKDVCPEKYTAKPGKKLPWWLVPLAGSTGYLLGKL